LLPRSAESWTEFRWQSNLSPDGLKPWGFRA
jgi:hypothetical protein